MSLEYYGLTMIVTILSVMFFTASVSSGTLIWDPGNTVLLPKSFSLGSSVAFHFDI